MQLKGLVWPTTWPSPDKDQSSAGLEGRKFKGWAGERIGSPCSPSAAVAGRQAGALIEQIALLLGLGQAVLTV